MTSQLARLHVNGAPIACRPGQVVLEALQSAGLLVQSACNGRAMCGLCRVHIEGGTASPPSVAELRQLPSAGQQGTARLACQLRLIDSVAIVVPKLEPH